METKQNQKTTLSPADLKKQTAKKYVEAINRSQKASFINQANRLFINKLFK